MGSYYHVQTKVLFLFHIETKHDLTEYLAKNLINQLLETQKLFVVTYHNISISNIPGYNPKLKVHQHEEADTLIILHALDVAAKDPHCDLRIVSPDTDVLLLLIYYYPQLCIRTVFKGRKGKDIRKIEIGKAYEALTPKYASALLGFHTFTGCDVTGKFNGKSKLHCWKQFLNCCDDEVEAFSYLGSGKNMPSQFVIFNLQQFVMKLYCKKGLTNIKNLGDLRWYLFSKCEKDIEKLPPTESSLLQAIHRSHYATYVMKTSNTPMPDLPNVEDYGWKLVETKPQPIMTSDLLVPTGLIELTRCGCKTKCDTNRCSCHKHNIICTDLCSCNQCENNEGKVETDLQDQLSEEFIDDTIDDDMID